MNRRPFVWPFVVATAVFAVTGLRADDAAKTGQFTETIKDRSPLSEMAALTARLGFAPGSFTDYDLASESFTVYVPAAYKPDGTFGAIVFINQGDEPMPYGGWSQVLDKHKMIWISPNKPTAKELNEVGRAAGLGLDAAAYVASKYKLDPSRLYASGVAGRQIGSTLAGAYPEVFTGGGLHILGSSFYRDLKTPGMNRYNTPTDALLKVARKQRVHVFVTGAESKDRAVVDRAAFEGYKADGYTAVDLIEMKGKGNEVPPADWFDKALAKLEDLRKTIKDSGVASTDVPNPNTPAPTTPTTPAPPATPTVPVVEAKRGTFDIIFDERAPESSVASLSRAFPTIARSAAEYDIAKETFHVHVPSSHEPGKPYGLIVGFSSEIADDDGQLPEIWRLTLEKRHFIWVGAGKCKLEAPEQRRMGLALDAVHNMRKRYTIDEDRIYALGLFKGAASPPKIAMNFPKVFAGAIMLQGGAFYRNTTVDGATVNAAFAAPGVNASLKESKGATRFVLAGPETGNNHKVLNILLKGGFKDDGFVGATYVPIDKLGDNIPQGNGVGKVLDEIDRPLIRTDRALMSEAARAEKMRKFETAWLLYGKAAVRTTDEKRKAEAEARIDGLKKLREEGLAGAKKALAAGDTVTGKSTLDRLFKEFGALPTNEVEKLLESLGGPAKTATARVPNAPGNEKGPPAAAGGNESTARARLAAAKKLLAVNLASGYRELRDVAERFGDTAAGKEAAAEADKIWADAGKRKTIETLIIDSEATKLLVLAKRYLDAGDFDNARDKLNQIVEDYPDSKAATEAASLLVGIKDK